MIKLTNKNIVLSILMGVLFTCSIVKANHLGRTIIATGGGEIHADSNFLSFTIGQPFIPPISSPLLSIGFWGGQTIPTSGCAAQCEKDRPCVCFKIQKNRVATDGMPFSLGDRLTIKLGVKVDQAYCLKPVDLYVAYLFPDGHLWFLNGSNLLPLVEPYQTNLIQRDDNHTILDTDIRPCFGGKYEIFAALVPKGGDFLVAYPNDFISNLAHESIELADLENPEENCDKTLGKNNHLRLE